jgi:hypothetical protein
MPPVSNLPVSELQSQLLATRRELAAVRRALQDGRVARRRPQSSYDTVQALSAVLQHSIPAALLELRAERDRLERDLGHTRTQLRTAKLKYSTLRYNVWQLAQRFFRGVEPPELVLEEVLDETADSEDDREWEEEDWAQ